jgi:gamma-glutamyltranspeptidase/glutathione hydrolase
MTRIARLLFLTGLLATLVASPPVAPAQTPVPAPAPTPTAQGTGGAVATVDPYATKIGMDVLRRGGNAVDAAIAAAAALGVVEPFSCGIGGGGFMVIRRANGKVTTIDGRETAPKSFPENAFIDPATGQPYPSSRLTELATSGLSVGVPGTVKSWELALDLFGTRTLNQLMAPAERLARLGFTVDPTFTSQVAANEARFKDFTTTRALFLPGDKPPVAGSTFRNPDLANTYRRIARNGSRALHQGAIARDIVNTVTRPPLIVNSTRNARPGFMTLGDLEGYRAKRRVATRTTYRGFQIVGMGPPSSGGSTVAEALNILEGLPMQNDTLNATHRYLEASKLAFADRGAYVGDPDFVKVPLTGLLSKEFAAQRRSLIGNKAMTPPVPSGNPWPYEPASQGTRPSRALSDASEGPSTTHLTTADRFGNVVSYTFTIESTGGNGIVVPQRGFLLNNELTDFDFATGRPNSPAGGKRPRSSMSPTIVLKDGAPVLALGSPGGSTIITTVLQVLVNRIDLVQSLPDAIAAPRASQRNTASVSAEPGFISSPLGRALAAPPYEHRFADGGEIGAVTAIEFSTGGKVIAAAEPARRGGGSAMAEQRSR